MRMCVMDVKVLRAFLTATQRVFRKMLDCEASIGQPAGSRLINIKADVIHASIDLSGDTTGLVLVQIHNDTAMAIAQQLLTASDTVIEVAGCVHDLSHWITDRARGDLRALRIKVSRPQIAVGSDVGSIIAGHRPWVTIPVESDHGPASLAFSIRKMDSPAVGAVGQDYDGTATDIAAA